MGQHPKNQLLIFLCDFEKFVVVGFLIEIPPALFNQNSDISFGFGFIGVNEETAQKN